MSYFSETVLGLSPHRYYRADETSGTVAVDSTGNSNGTWSGTVTLGISSWLGRGFRCVSSGSGFFFHSVALSGSFSLMYMYKYDGVNNSVIWRDNTSSSGWLLLFAGAGGADLTIRAAGTDHTITGGGTTLQAAGPYDGWHFVVHTFSGTQMLTYFDGTLVDTFARTTSSMPSSTVRFGRNGSQTSFYNSYYDEIAWWNGVVLTQTDVDNLVDAINWTMDVTDNMGMTDARSYSMEKIKVENLGLTDAFGFGGTEEPLDPMGLTDSASVLLEKRMTIVDNLGLTDAPVAEVIELGERVDNPFDIGGVEGQFTLDMLDFGVDGGESVPAGVTKTAWFQYTSSDATDLGVRFTSTNVDVTVQIYDDAMSLIDSQDDANPLDISIPISDEGEVFYLQLGVRPGDDEDITLVWEDSSPPVYEDPSTPLQIDGEYGRNEVEIVPGGEAWVMWVAPTTTTITFVVTGDPSSASFDLDAYEGDTSTLVESSTGSAEVTISVDVTAGESYWLKFSSLVGMTFGFTYTILPVTAAPADSYDTLVVEVYEPDGMTRITELSRRFGVNFQEPLNEVGMGEVTISLSDPILEAYPQLLDWKNIVKIWIGDKCVHAFKIKRKRTKLVSTEEGVDRRRTIAGPSVMHLLDDFIVRHDGLMTDRSLDVRNFGWMSMSGEWFEPGFWNGPYNSNPQSDPPSDFNQAPKDRAKWHQPDQWPDPTSDWIWISHNPTKNEGGFNPPALEGKRYYRKSFTIANGAVNARLYATGDEIYRVYLDGELVLEGDGKETGYTELGKVKVRLRQGQHTIAVFSRSRGNQSVDMDGADAFMMSLMKINKRGKPTSVILNTGPNWNTTYQRPVPTWNKAYVMRAVVREAKDRGVTSANMLTFDFTGTTDSSGRAWVDRYSEEIQIGTSGLEVQGLLSENGGFDVWVDPETFELKAWRRRGVDKSASVTLEMGRNITDWEVEEVDEVKNDFLIQYDGGWTRYVAKGSRDIYGEREGFVTLGYAKDDEAAERVIRKASNGIAWAVERAGTGEIVKRKEINTTGGMIAVDGARPFLDFEVGDTIKAPNKQGIMKPHRVLMITATEDEQGRVSYDPQCEEVR